MSTSASQPETFDNPHAWRDLLPNRAFMKQALRARGIDPDADDGLDIRTRAIQVYAMFRQHHSHHLPASIPKFVPPPDILQGYQEFLQSSSSSRSYSPPAPSTPASVHLRTDHDPSTPVHRHFSSASSTSCSVFATPERPFSLASPFSSPTRNLRSIALSSSSYPSFIQNATRVFHCHTWSNSQEYVIICLTLFICFWFL